MNKLEEIINGLNKFEVKAFKSYLQSAYFNTDKGLAKAFDNAVKQCHSQKFIDKQKVFKHTYSSAYNDKLWRYVQSFLCKQLEYFLTLRYLDSNKLLYNNLLLQTLANKGYEKPWHFVHQEITASKAEKNAAYYLQQFIAAENALEFLSVRQSRKKKFDYESIFTNLDSFYMAKKLQLACEVINLKNILKADISVYLINEIAALAQGKLFKDVVVIQVYLRIYLTLTDPGNQIHFTDLRSLIKEHHQSFSIKELNDFYVYAKNYCIKKINAGNPSYNKTLLEIYREILSNKKLMYYEWLSQFEFKNIVTVALREEEKTWCKDFIEKYITFVKPPEQRNALNFNMAHYLFATGKYKEAIKKLSDVEFTDIAYQVDSRVILLKCYYEIQDGDAFFYHASAFRLFLLRNRYLSEFQKTFNRNLIIFLSALFRANGSKIKIAKLKARVEAEKNVADINWLLEKIEESE